MGYRVISYRNSSNDVRDFEEAAAMAKEGLEKMCELADEMREQYGERGGRYGMRGGYGRREHGWDDPDMDYGERRSRDSRGRYM